MARDNDLLRSARPWAGPSRPRSLKIVKAETFRNAFFVVGNGQVFRLFRSIGIGLLILCLTLHPALGFLSRFLLPLPLFLALGKSGSRASSHEHAGGLKRL